MAETSLEHCVRCPPQTKHRVAGVYTPTIPPRRGLGLTTGCHVSDASTTERLLPNKRGTPNRSPAQLVPIDDGRRKRHGLAWTADASTHRCCPGRGNRRGYSPLREAGSGQAPMVRAVSAIVPFPRVTVRVADSHAAEQRPDSVVHSAPFDAELLELAQAEMTMTAGVGVPGLNSSFTSSATSGRVFASGPYFRRAVPPASTAPAARGPLAAWRHPAKARHQASYAYQARSHGSLTRVRSIYPGSLCVKWSPWRYFPFSNDVGCPVKLLGNCPPQDQDHATLIPLALREIWDIKPLINARGQRE